MEGGGGRAACPPGCMRVGERGGGGGGGSVGVGSHRRKPHGEMAF